MKSFQLPLRPSFCVQMGRFCPRHEVCRVIGSNDACARFRTSYLFCWNLQARWGTEYNETLFSKGMRFSDGGKVVEDKMLNAVLEQGGFLAAFTGE